MADNCFDGDTARPPGHAFRSGNLGKAIDGWSKEVENAFACVAAIIGNLGIAPGVQDLAALKAVPVADRFDKQARLVEDEGVYFRFDEQNAGPADVDHVKADDGGPGFWIRMPAAVGPPFPHAATHLTGGGDAIPEFVGATAGADGTEGLVKKPLLGQQLLFLKADGTWAAPMAGGVTAVRVLAADPVGPSVAGDVYYNSVLQMEMYYDSVRGKWLSTEAVTLFFGRTGNTGSGAFYRGPGNRAYSAVQGRTADFPGTVVSLSYTRSDTDAATFEVTADGASIVGSTVASSAVKGKDTALDGDFAANVVLGIKNQAGGNTTRNVHGWVRLKWRAP